MAGDKPIIRIAVPGDTAEDFMQAAAKQFRGDFFVAIDQPVGKFVRIEAPFLNGDVGVRGDAIAMPAVRNGRKGLVIRLVRLDPDSLGIPIQESSKALGIDDDDAVEEFDSSQSTITSGVSAAVAKSIRAAGTATPTPATGVPKPAAKSPSQPTSLDELDDETREAVNEFGEVSTRASEVSADLAKKLADEPAPVTAHAVRRATPEQGIPKQPKGVEVRVDPAHEELSLDDAEPADSPEAAAESAPNAHQRTTLKPFPAEPEPDRESAPAPTPKPEPESTEVNGDAPASEAAPDPAPEAKATAKPKAPEPATKPAVTTEVVEQLPAPAKPRSDLKLLLLLLVVAGAGAGAYLVIKNLLLS